MRHNNNCPNWLQNYDKQPNIRHAFGGPLYRWSFASAAGFLDQEARWLYEKATSRKRQATSNKQNKA